MRGETSPEYWVIWHLDFSCKATPPVQIPALSWTCRSARSQQLILWVCSFFLIFLLGKNSKVLIFIMGRKGRRSGSIFQLLPRSVLEGRLLVCAHADFSSQETQENPQVTGVSQSSLLLLWLSFRFLKVWGSWQTPWLPPPSLSPVDHGSKE